MDLVWPKRICTVLECHKWVGSYRPTWVGEYCWLSHLHTSITTHEDLVKKQNLTVFVALDSLQPMFWATFFKNPFSIEFPMQCVLITSSSVTSRLLVRILSNSCSCKCDRYSLFLLKQNVLRFMVDGCKFNLPVKIAIGGCLPTYPLLAVDIMRDGWPRQHDT